MTAANRLPIRLRIAAAFALATAIALVALGTFIYFRVESTLTQQSRETLATQLDALARLPGQGRADATAAMSGEFFAQMTTPDGRLLGSSPQVSGTVLSAADAARSTRADLALERPVRLTGEDEPEVSLLLARRVSDQVLVVGTSQARADDALDGVLSQFLVGGPLALILGSALGYLVAGSALRPVERMRRRAAEISSTSTGARLPLPAANDEIHRLGCTLNSMLDRLDAGMQQQRRFVAEASHELRTPLSLLRMELDLALSRPRSPDELIAALSSANDEVSRLTALSEGLLTVAATDNSPLPLEIADVDIGRLLHDVARRFSTQAAAQGLRIDVRTDGSLLIVAGDPARLHQAVGNLVDNALRHGGTDVAFNATGQPSGVIIKVSDRGPGLSEDLRPRALDPFSRDARSRPGRGHGLGLAIVDAIVTAHGGTTAIGPHSDGVGTEVEIALPTRPGPGSRTWPS
jgi:signal transduction histidine kinase